MRGCVFVGGEAPSKCEFEAVRQPYDLAVAADSGYDLARAYGVAVDVIVGDMDSVRSPDYLRESLGVQIMRFHGDKDETDTEIGLRVLREAGCRESTIVGGGGGRLDHLFAILALFDRSDPPSRWLPQGYSVVLVDGEIEIHERAGSTVSFFPVGAEECTMRTRGLKWPLDGLVWRKGDAGVSNIVVGEEAGIEMASGRLIMVSDLHVLSGVSA